MLRSIRGLDNFGVLATDGDIGKISDFYFDDKHWTIRYLVVNTEQFWQSPHEVLISPIAFREADWQTRRFNLSLTRQKVKNSPDVDLHKPISRQYESNYSQYYDWPGYWQASDVWGSGAYPDALVSRAWNEQPDHDTNVDPHLRSIREVTGYHIHGTDDDIGHVQDFIVDDESWSIRYLVVDTSNLWFGKSVLVAPRWIDRISWQENNVYVNLPREVIRNSPEWKPEEPVNREYEVRLYDYYGRPAYWLDGPAKPQS